MTPLERELGRLAGPARCFFGVRRAGGEPPEGIALKWRKLSNDRN